MVVTECVFGAFLAMASVGSCPLCSFAVAFQTLAPMFVIVLLSFASRQALLAITSTIRHTVRGHTRVALHPGLRFMPTCFAGCTQT